MQCGETEFSDSTDLAVIEGCRLVARIHPFKTAERIDQVVPDGLTLLEMLELAQTDPILRSHAHIFIDDIRIERHLWHVVRPKAGRTITINVVPQGGGGGGGKSPLRTILTLAVIVAAIYFGPALGAAMGVPSAGITFGSTVITAGQIGGALITVVGTLLVNAIAPIRPPKLGQLSGGNSVAESPTLFITGTQNQAQPFGIIPCVLGRNRMVPPYGALPYTEVIGENQFLRLVVVWGYGPLKIEDLKIGETPIDQYTEVEYVTRQGFIGDPDLTLFSQDVYEENLSVLLTQAGGYVSRVSTSEADEISVDFVFTQGLAQYGGNDKQPATVEVDVEYRKVGTSTWYGAGETFIQRTSAAMIAETGSVTIREGVSHAAITPHRIDLVVLDRMNGDIQVIKGNVAFGTAVAERPATPSTAIAIAAVARGMNATVVTADITDLRPADAPFDSPSDFAPAQTSPLSNAIYVGAGTLDSARQSFTDATSQTLRKSVRFKVPERAQYDVRVRRVTADSTDGTLLDTITWATLRTVTNEPPFDATGLATTEIRIKATDQLNSVVNQINGIVTSIVPDYDADTGTWLVRETNNNASLFRTVLQGPGNARPMEDSRIDLDKLAYWHTRNVEKGLAFNMVRDFASSVWDTLSDISSAAFAGVAQVDNKWSVVIDEDKVVPVQHFTPRNSWGFSFERSYPEQPHGWRIRFVNEDNGFKQDERIVYADGYDASNATKFESLELPGITDPDQIWIVGRQRIAEAKLRPERYMLSSDLEYLVCTRGDLVLITHDVISVGIAAGRIKSVALNGDGDAVSVTVDEALTMEPGHTYGLSIRTPTEVKLLCPVVNTPGEDIYTVTFITPVDAASIPAAGDLFGFGETDQETLEALVLSIAPQPDLVAELTFVPLSRAIFDAATGDIPEFNPNISLLPFSTVPFIVAIRSDETVLVELPSGLLVPCIAIALGRFSSSYVNNITGVEVQYKPSTESTWSSRFVPKQEALDIRLLDVVQGVTYDIRARYVKSGGIGSSDFSTTIQHTVVGMSTPPEDVTGLVIEGNYLRWHSEEPADFAGYQVRSSTDVDAAWGSMIPAHPGFLSHADFDIANFRRGLRKFAVKMIDLAGNENVTVWEMGRRVS